MFASTDYVRVELDSEIFEMMQQNHGGWNSSMAKVTPHLALTLPHSRFTNICNTYISVCIYKM